MKQHPPNHRVFIYTILIILLNLFQHLKIDHWIFELFINIFVQVFYFTIFWAIYLMIRKKYLLAIFMMTILILQIIFMVFSIKPSTAYPHKTENNFTIMSTNVLNTNTHTQKILHDIHSSNAETIAILELSSRQWNELKENQKLIHSYPYQMIKTHEYEHFGIGILSKYPFIHKEWVYSTKSMIPSAKITQFTKIGIVNAVFTHAHSPLNHSGYTERNSHLKKIAQMEPFIKNKPYFIVGDFNMTKWSPWFKKFLKQSNLNFYRTNDFWNYTWYLNPYLPIGLHIDHFFHNDFLHVVQTKIGPYIGSDHRSLTVTMTSNMKL